MFPTLIFGYKIFRQETVGNCSGPNGLVMWVGLHWLFLYDRFLLDSPCRRNYTIEEGMWTGNPIQGLHAQIIPPISISVLNVPKRNWSRKKNLLEILTVNFCFFNQGAHLSPRIMQSEVNGLNLLYKFFGLSLFDPI